MPRPVAYLRKSKSDDPAKEVSREVQEHAVRTLASRDGFNGDLKLYVDWDRSADQSKSARRTAYREMVRAIEAGEVSVVYAYATDRLYRSVSTFIELMKTARDHGARIVTERDGVVGGDGSPMANAFAQVGAVFAELELNTAKSRARAAHAVRVARGDFVGNPPYGWRVAKDAGGVNRLEPDPEKPVAPILEAFERSGRRPRSAVRILNDELGIPAQHGGTWDTASLKRLIHREAPHLLPRRAWSGRRDPVGRPALLAKLLLCHCGRLLTPLRHRERRWAQETVQMSYYCSRGMTQRGTHPRVYVSERLLLDWVRSESARLRTPNRVKLAEANRDERRKLEDRRERLGWALADGLLDRDAARARALEIDSELEALDAQEEVVDVPTIDWAWPTDALNDVLRAIWRYIELDENLRPVRAEWTVPAWRSGRASSARESTPVDATPVS